MLLFHQGSHRSIFDYWLEWIHEDEGLPPGHSAGAASMKSGFLLYLEYPSDDCVAPVHFKHQTSSHVGIHALWPGRLLLLLFDRNQTWMILNTCFARYDLSATMTCFSQQHQRVVSSKQRMHASKSMMKFRFFFWWDDDLYSSNRATWPGNVELMIHNALCLGRKWSIGITIFRALLCCGERELLSGLYPYLGDSPRSRMYSGSFDSRRTWNIKPTPLFLPHLKPFRDNNIVNAPQMLEFLETISDILQSFGQELCLCWSCPSDYHVAVESSVAWTKVQDRSRYM